MARSELEVRQVGARWLVLCLALPGCYVLYSRLALGIGLTSAGVADALIFVMPVALVLLSAWRARTIWIRGPICAGVSVLLSILMIGNTYYYDAFHSWIRFHLFLQWRAGPAIAGGILESMTVWDYATGVTLPMMMVVVMTSVRRPSISMSWLSAGIAIWVASLLAQPLLRSSSLDLRDHEVLTHLLREGLDYWRNGDRGPVGSEDRIWEYFPIPGDGYRVGSDPKRPLLAVPSESDGVAARLPLSPGEKPNIVLVLMESLRSLESGAYGAEPSFTPELDALASDGLLFHNFYANGSQTVRGELATLTSFYPDYMGAPIYDTRPALRLSSLPEILRSHGYRTHWISGYDADFSNKAVFLRAHGIDEIHDDGDMPEGALEIGWGVADDEIFRYAETVFDRQDEPFFAEIMTLSNHWPFQWPYPVEPPSETRSKDERYAGYTRGIYYADWAIGRFIERARKKPWFERTIFVFLGDHSIWIYPEDQKFETVRKQEAYFRVPLIFYAPALIEPERSLVVGSQVDVAPTLLDMLGLRAPNAFVGRSLMGTARGLERYALMLHLAQWNLRVGDHYIYDTGREVFVEHFPKAPVGYLPHLNDEHVHLTTGRDLLRVEDDRDVHFGSDEERERYIQWTTELLGLGRLLMEEDRVFAQPGGYADTSSADRSEP